MFCLAWNWFHSTWFYNTFSASVLHRAYSWCRLNCLTWSPIVMLVIAMESDTVQFLIHVEHYGV